MKLDVFTDHNLYEINDTSLECNQPNIDQHHQLFYSKYMSSKLHKIEKSTYLNVFKSNNQSYIFYLFSHYPTYEQQNIIYHNIFKQTIGITQNTFKCKSFFPSGGNELSSNFQLDETASGYIKIGKFIFSKVLNENLVSKKEANQNYNKFINNIDTSKIKIKTQINNYLQKKYCKKDYFMSLNLSASLQNPPIFNQLSPLSSIQLNLLQLQKKLDSM